MKKIIAKLSFNQKSAAVAFILGIIALFAGDPYHGAYATLDTKELSVIVQNEVDHITVEELADWIIAGRADFRLIDLRSEKDFEEYHIPQSENISITGLSNPVLPRNEKIILYSDGGIHSAQAWFLLKAQQYKGVYILRGGLDEWKDAILFPAISANANDEERASFEKKRSIALFFGGVPQSGVHEGVKTAIAMPKMPSTSAVIPKAGNKKKKEGC